MSTSGPKGAGNRKTEVKNYHFMEGERLRPPMDGRASWDPDQK